MKKIFFALLILVFLAVNSFSVETGNYKYFQYGADFNLTEWVADVNGQLDTDFSSTCYVNGKNEATNAQVFDGNQMLNDPVLNGLYYLQVPASNTVAWPLGKYNVVMSCSDHDLNGTENVSFIIGKDVVTLIEDTNRYLGQLIIDTNAIGRGLSVDQNQLLYDIKATILDINGRTWITAADVWNYANRVLTDYNQADMWEYLIDINAVNYSINSKVWISANDVWAYASRSLTDYNQQNMFNYLADINATTATINGKTWISAGDVWAYSSRALTDYNQSDMWSYLMDVNAVTFDMNTNVWVSAADVWAYTTRALTDYNQLGIFVYLSDMNTNILNIKASQEQDFRVVLSDFGRIANGDTYRAKLWVFDFNGSPVDADSTPEITLYDPSRNVIAQDVDLNRIEKGIYTYSFVTTSGSTAGEWEAVASATVKGETVKPSDFWELTGNPPEVKVNSITDTTVPTITADVTITNEGANNQEYQYEYCIVDDQANQCGGNDDIDYGSGARLILAGKSVNMNLTLNVVSIGTYWFKIKVYYGTETSAASRQFVATQETAPPATGPGGAGGGMAKPGAAGKIKITALPGEMVVHRGSFDFFLVNIQNSGEGKLSNLSLALDGMAKEWVEIDQDKKSLNPGEVVSFVIKITVPEKAEAEDRLINLRVLSDEDSAVSSSVLRILEKPVAEIIFSEINISKLFENGGGKIEVVLYNNSLKDMPIKVSLLAPVDWQVENSNFDLNLAAGKNGRAKFYIRAVGRAGVDNLILTVTSMDGTIFTGVGENRVSKELIAVVHAAEKEGAGAPSQALLTVPLEWINAAIILIVLAVLVVVLIKILPYAEKKISKVLAFIGTGIEWAKTPKTEKLFEIKNIETGEKTFKVIAKVRGREEPEAFVFDLGELGKTSSWKKKIEDKIISDEMEAERIANEIKKKELERKLEEAKKKAAAKKAELERKQEEASRGKESPDSENMIILGAKIEAMERTIENQKKALARLQEESIESRKNLVKEKEEVEKDLKKSKEKLEEKLQKLEQKLKSKKGKSSKDLAKEKKDLQKSLKQLRDMNAKKILPNAVFQESGKKIKKRLAEINKKLAKRKTKNKKIAKNKK